MDLKKLYKSLLHEGDDLQDTHEGGESKEEEEKEEEKEEEGE
jgi:hypothetical protein